MIRFPLTLAGLAQLYKTRKFRCRRLPDLQDFLVLGPTKYYGSEVLRFSIMNLETGNFHDVNARSETYVMLSNSVELGFINRLSESEVLSTVRRKYL